MSETESKQHLSPEELKELIAEGGAELSEKDLEQISGGWNNDQTCPPGQHRYEFHGMCGADGKSQLFVCAYCGDSYVLDKI